MQEASPDIELKEFAIELKEFAATTIQGHHRWRRLLPTGTANLPNFRYL